MSSMELVLKAGPSQGRVIALSGVKSVTIGRATGNDVVLKDDKVSSRHARLDIAPGGVILTDLGSKNGTYADGESIVGSRLLSPNVDVSVGNTVFALREKVEDSKSSPPTDTIEIKAKRQKPVDSGRDLVIQPPQHHTTRNLSKAQRNLAILMSVGELLATERDVDRFLGRVLDTVFDVLPADRGSALILDADGEPRAAVTRLSPRAEKKEALRVSRTILNKVLEGGVSILTADAGTDTRLSSGISVIAQSIRSAMCVPIRGRNRILGALYVDTVLGIGVFGKDDLDVLSTLGLLAGTGIENIRLIEKSLETERMAAIGGVIAGLGHDIRNMMTALRGGIYLVDELMKENEDPDAQQAWQIVRHGHESITGLVQDMVNYSKPREPEWRLADVNQVARTAVSMAHGTAKEKRVQVTSLLDDTISPFWFDSKALERCVMNLLSNAVDAAPSGRGVVSVATQVDDARKRVRVVVQDNGEGIPPENREKIFDLLFSTKGSRGTGFGLAITKKIMEEHGGRIGLRTEVGQGSVFTLELPLRDRSPLRDHERTH